MANINELLDGHVTLEVECIDRMYLNGYIAVNRPPSRIAANMVGDSSHLSQHSR